MQSGKSRKKEKKMITSKKFFIQSIALINVVLIGACITVNVNFPESAVKKTADDFVADLYKTADKSGDVGTAPSRGVAKKKGPATTKPESKAETKTEPTKDGATLFFDRLDNFRFPNFELISSAQASELDEIKSRMASRLAELSRLKADGTVCETRDGLVKLKNPAKAGGNAAKIAKLLETENNDRELLYEDARKANRVNSGQLQRVRELFADSFRAKSPPSGVCED